MGRQRRAQRPDARQPVAALDAALDNRRGGRRRAGEPRRRPVRRRPDNPPGRNSRRIVQPRATEGAFSIPRPTNPPYSFISGVNPLALAAGVLDAALNARRGDRRGGMNPAVAGQGGRWPPTMPPCTRGGLQSPG